MENASKALLIAAAVLIVILIIAFGMKIFNSTGDTSADAVEVGKSVKEGTTSASSEVLKQNILSCRGKNKTVEEQEKVINSIIEYNKKVDESNKIGVKFIRATKVSEVCYNENTIKSKFPYLKDSKYINRAISLSYTESGGLVIGLEAYE